MIRGVTVILNERQEGIEKDPFGVPVVSYSSSEVKNVLIAPVSSLELADMTRPNEERTLYRLSIPKGDRHNWEGGKVYFFGTWWRVVGRPVGGIPELIPLSWDRWVDVAELSEEG